MTDLAEPAPGLGRHTAVVVRSVALVVAAGTTTASGLPGRHLVWTVPLALMVFWRWAEGTRFRPPRLPSTFDAGADLVLTSLAVVATGGLSSGFVFYAVVSVGILAVERGWPRSGLGAAVCCALVLIGVLTYGPAPSPVAGMVWAAELVMGLGTGAYARRLLAAAGDDRRHRLAQVDRLARNNAQLAELCRAVSEGALPTDVLACARRISEQVHELLRPETVVIIGINEPVEERCEVLLADGAALPSTVARSSLPPAALEAYRSGRPLVITIDRRRSLPAGFSPDSRSAIYLPLVVGGRPLGLMAVESDEALRWDNQDITVAEALAAQAALSIDNARRFAMLCVTGLAEERVRLAGELHDRTGQAVAALGLQLDIIMRRVEDQETKQALQSLRMGVRSVVADLRSTMSALRCEVTEEVDLAQALQKLAGHHRVRPQVTVTTTAGDRLPLLRERQVYLLAREAIAAAASAGADNVSVCWYWDEGVPSLMVVDDAPTGVAPSRRHTGSGRVSTFSLETMKARCESLQGRFHLTRTTRGTVLRCSL